MFVCRLSVFVWMNLIVSVFRCCLFNSAVSTSPSPHMNPAAIDLGEFPRASWVNTIMHFPPLFLIQTSIDYFPYVQVRPSVRLSLGASADKQGDGAGPRKGSTFWKSKFDMKSNQLLQPIPSLTAGVARSTTKNTKLSSGPFIQNAFCLEIPIVI